MPVNPDIVTNEESRTFVQTDGIGNEFELYACHAITGWTQDFGEPIYIRIKDPSEYGKRVNKETISGSPGQPTFTVIAYTAQEADYLMTLKRAGCQVDWQVHFGACSSPSDRTGYLKIRHFYRASLTSIGEENVDFLDQSGDTTGEAIIQTGEFSAEDVIEILQVSTTRQNSGVTETQAFNDIAFVTSTRCEGDCGAEVSECEWGMAVCDANYGAATSNVWYTNDSGGTWTLCATDPFASNAAHCSSCVIMLGETAPRMVAFQGSVSGTYGSRCSISTDWGASWSEVDMGGTTNGTYVNGAYLYSAGKCWAVGNGGYIYYSEDQCSSWTEITGTTTGTAVELWDIHSPDDDRVYAVGDNDTVIISSDSGTSWSATGTTPAAGTENLYTVQAPTRYRVIVGGQVDGSNDCLWMSEDAGATWSDLDFTGSTTASGAVRRVRLTSVAPQQHWIFIHGTETVTTRYGAGSSFRFYRTLDGGGSFEQDNLVANNGMNGLAVCNVNRAWAAGEVNAAGVGDILRMSN